MGAEMALVPNGGAGLDTHTTWGTTESIQNHQRATHVPHLSAG